MSRNIISSTAMMLVRRRMKIFVFSSCFGFFSLVFFRVGISNLIDPNTYSMQTFKFIERIVLPRTNFEIDQISARLGLIYAGSVILMDISIVIFCSFALVLCLNDAARYPTCNYGNPKNINMMSRKEITIALIICFGSLVLSPANFDRPSIYTNYVDKFGFYFVKEGLLITIGCFYFCCISVNIFFSVFMADRIFVPHEAQGSRDL